MTLDPSARVDFERFGQTLERSGEIGTGRPGGLSRLTLTEADRQMREQFVAWCEEAGLAVRIDAMGSIFGRRAGREDLPPVLIGSHLDTQVDGGRFDGIVGVLGALEVVRRLNDLGITTRRPIEIVNWTNEEGSRFSPPMVASGCFVGAYALDWAYGRTDEDGVTLGSALEAIGFRGEGAVTGHDIDGYFELHIEQADLLYTEGQEVGVVTHAYRSHGALVQFTGETAHTGPTPMARRRNALVAGARTLVAVDDIGWAHAKSGGKGTAARLAAWPNKAGILSDWCEVVVDVRHADPATADAMRDAMLAAAAEAADKAGCDYRILDRWSWGGDIFDAEMVGTVRETTRALGYSWRDMPSQAGHDAYFIAQAFPTAMIFTPCEKGITHNHNELATRAQLEPGLNVLLHAVVRRADRP